MARKKRKKKKSNGGSGVKTVIIAALITFIVGAFVVYKYTGKVSHPRPHPTYMKGAGETKVVSLYLTDADGLGLKPIKHRIKKAPIEKELLDTVVALVEDPAGTIPAGTRVLGVRVRQATAIVDFSSEIVKNHPGGSSGETQTIYSIVDTILLNFPEVKDVRILVEGKTKKTLAGHIDISLPLGPDTDIISK
ncbi:MAG: GerMN domain-containing protein [Thermodesulfobacteriota bacterium]